MFEKDIQGVMKKWSFVFADSTIEKDFYNSPKKICIAAHSTPFFDGFILYQALKYFGEENAVVYARGPCPYFPQWCKQIDGTGGFIQKECNALGNSSHFCRVIFPSGGTVTWKTGFYILAKKLNATIVILGIDYKNSIVVVDGILNLQDDNPSFEKIKNTCITRLCKYKAGPFCYILRMLFNYGCETYSFDYNILYFSRGLLFFAFFLCFSL